MKLNKISVAIFLLIAAPLTAFADMSCHSKTLTGNNEWVVTVTSSDPDFSTADVRAELYENGRPSFGSAFFSGKVHTTDAGFEIVDQGSKFVVSGVQGTISGPTSLTDQPLDEALVCHAL